VKKAGKDNILKTAIYFKEKVCTLRQFQDKAILLDTGLFFENYYIQEFIDKCFDIIKNAGIESL